MFFGQSDAFFRLHITQDEQHGVIRHIVRFEKALHVSQVGGIKIGKITVEIVRVGPITEGHGRHVEPGETAIRLVHDVDANFFFHNVALIFKIFVIHFQSAHAVRFKPQDALQRIRRHSLVIIRHVVTGRAVQHAAAGIDQLDVLHLRGIRGTLEHHVFEEMRKPAASLRFEPEANFVVNGHGDHRSRCVRCDHHVQAICQFGAFDSNLESFHEPPPVAFAFEISPKELLSSSLNTLVASSASARAAR